MIFCKKYKQLKKDYEQLEKELNKLNKENYKLEKIRKNHQKKLNDLDHAYKEKYINSKKVENRFVAFMIILFILFFIILICVIYNDNITSSYKKFLIPMFITISSILFINLPESILGLFIRKEIKKDEAKFNKKEVTSLIISAKSIGSLIMVITIVVSLVLYDNSPVYTTDIDTKQFRIKFTKDMNILKDDGKTRSLNDFLDKEKYNYELKEVKNDKVNKEEKTKK
ncbi:hypothetical protein [Staphylococcus epidermidis]|uniref:hypothetical protein n=1 Tax=Staphylococcus epidermidis TaxID=1282 RepID=UPI00029938A2|nr:hypothetical protein [Staphylococcus epidermidis]EKS23234.1 hypothetical protein HMPREF9281_02436 [Staphylococcus epidermidis BVS058A4]